ncbi:MAG: YraN family protein [Alphaproteobacteria bacterium]|nr:MAG: YraN family protein [Alphaproteobacteria bacterium]PZO41386.1 MAG: YraN family protein [Alphaproteobacteria bacterium]
MKPDRVRAPRPVARPKSAWRKAQGARAHREGHGAEWVAAIWLMLRGYQILGFRMRSRAGEIDILARRGRVLAVVEVKHRATMQAAANALGPDQYQRLLAAGRAVLKGRPGLAGLSLRIDVVALAPGRIPRHLPGRVSQEGRFP